MDNNGYSSSGSNSSQSSAAITTSVGGVHNSQNGHKGTSLHCQLPSHSYENRNGSTLGDHTTMPNNQIYNSTGTRRSEVSPIQNHNTSRVGWQSPQEMSLKLVETSFNGFHSPVKMAASSKIMKHSNKSNHWNGTVNPYNQPTSSPRPHIKNNIGIKEIHTDCVDGSMNKKSHDTSYYSGNTLSDNFPLQCDVNYMSNNMNRYQQKKHQSHTLGTELNGNSDKVLIHDQQRNRNFHPKEHRYGKIMITGPKDCNETYDSNIFDFEEPQPIIKRPNPFQNSNKLQISCTPSYQNNNLPQQNGWNGKVNSNELASSVRSNSYNNKSSGNHLAAMEQYQVAHHIINSLSSPESAYSTGYSTDGTSPGANTTPECYINMRTGTHYFPRSAGSVIVEKNRKKFGLNKIDEVNYYETSYTGHRRSESTVVNGSKSLGREFDLMNGTGNKNDDVPNWFNIHPGISPDVQRRFSMLNCKGIESPSPRQRCKIKTNPWLDTAGSPFMNRSASSKIQLTVSESTDSWVSGNEKRKIEADSCSTSSGIKSCSETGNDDKNGKIETNSESETESSSTTEIDLGSRILATPQRRNQNDPIKSENAASIRTNPDSDEDATLNEMMGKFDESYVYEKETDILSDSDPTECLSDLDTGQDGGDECDTDELLDIDYIDTGSTQEINDKNAYWNTGNCSYHTFGNAQERKPSKPYRSKTNFDESLNANSKRKKKLRRTRKKVASETKEQYDSLNKKYQVPGCQRESRSLGGTPISLRRNQSKDRSKSSDSTQSKLVNRCNSLTLTEIHSIRNKVVAITESENALIKADMEADKKYKQLIHEAESLLVTMKSNVHRDSPVPSPRRICNLPTIKRVEMLRNCESDLRRDVIKNNANEIILSPKKSSIDSKRGKNQSDSLIVFTKSVNVYKSELSAETSNTKMNKFSPRKTHVTNFINQLASPTDMLKRRSIPSSDLSMKELNLRSPCLHLNGKRYDTNESQPVRNTNFHLTDSDSEKEVLFKYGNPGNEISTDDENHNTVDQMVNNNVDYDNNIGTDYEMKRTQHLVSFKSIGIGMSGEFNSQEYCPQSEPVKRKVYTGGSTFERIKKSLEIETGSGFNRQKTEMGSENNLHKQQLLLNTIQSLKRNLHDQSVQLNGLNHYKS